MTETRAEAEPTTDPEPATDAPTLPTRFSFFTPSDWVQVDVSTDGPAAARRFVEQLVASAPQRDRRREVKVAAAFQGAVRKMRHQGAVMAAFWSQRADDRLVGASVVVAVRPVKAGTVVRPDGTVDVDLAVRMVAGAEGGEAILDSRLVELPAGPARRVRKTQVVEMLGQRHETDVVQFYVLAPDRRQLVVLTFSTPTVELAEPLGELFDALAGGLRWRP